MRDFEDSVGASFSLGTLGGLPRRASPETSQWRGGATPKIPMHVPHPTHLSANHLRSLQAAFASIAPEQPDLSQSAGSFTAYITN
ncbi:hypothetical protein KUCAC02_026099 [Chaenocephalus aceratus]|uniref:Uncharacterized protein n=1 Tax=Chaenocephalus aceratus TaxID=36190 RepID=A0ACB9VW61_CHAAC|nr:hypothetical protein KUCAC02_026099 [Chaenocephalus aceratus]